MFHSDRTPLEVSHHGRAVHFELLSKLIDRPSQLSCIYELQDLSLGQPDLPLPHGERRESHRNES